MSILVVGVALRCSLYAMHGVGPNLSNYSANVLLFFRVVPRACRFLPFTSTCVHIKAV